MEKKNIFIAVILVFAVFLIAINFDKFTGQAVRGIQEMTEVEVETKNIASGDYIYFTLYPGQDCIHRDLQVKSTDAALSKRQADTFSDKTGRSTYCKEITLRYKTGGDWAEGDYVIRARDLATDTWVEDTFYIAG